MNALQAVEEKLGPISKWPSYIVHHMTYTKPIDDTTMKFITAFFYGNGIEAKKAWKCYSMLNNPDEAVIREGVRHYYKAVIREGVQRYYNKWANLEVTTVLYFNMSSNKLVRINGDIGDEIDIHAVRLPLD
jgi:hypothetical protein